MSRLVPAVVLCANSLVTQGCDAQSEADRFVTRATELAALPSSCRNSVVREHRTLEETDTAGESFTLNVGAKCRAQWLEALENDKDFLCPADVKAGFLGEGDIYLCMLESGKEPLLKEVWIAFKGQSTVDFAVVTSR